MKSAFFIFSSVDNNRDVTGTAVCFIASVWLLSKLRQEEARYLRSLWQEVECLLFGYYSVFLVFTIYTLEREKLFAIHTLVFNELTQTNAILLCLQ